MSSGPRKEKKGKLPFLIADWRLLPLIFKQQAWDELWESGCRGVLAQENQGANRLERRLWVLLNCYISELEFVLDYELPGVAL